MGSRKGWILGFIALFLFIIVVDLWQEGRVEPDVSLERSGYFDYVGVVHFHTIYSDGSGTFKEVAKVANEIGLDFLVSSDHNTIQPLLEGKEGWYGKTLVLCGDEISTRAGHYLSMNIAKDISQKAVGSVQGVIDAVADEGGLGFIAHPFHPRMAWSDWKVTNFTGMELVNADSEWRNDGILELLESLLGYAFSEYGALNNLADRPRANLRKWDELLQGRKVVGIGSADAHANIKLGKERSLKFPSYERVFNSIHTHILTSHRLTGNLEHDKLAVYSALQAGHCYVVYEGFCDASGFAFEGTNGHNRAMMGDEIALNDGVEFTVAVSDTTDTLIELLKDGDVVRASKNGRLKYRTTKAGVYRVEVYQLRRSFPFWRLSKRPWIFSNPIYVRKQRVRESVTARRTPFSAWHKSPPAPRKSPWCRPAPA